MDETMDQNNRALGWPLAYLFQVLLGILTKGRVDCALEELTQL